MPFKMRLMESIFPDVDQHDQTRSRSDTKDPIEYMAGIMIIKVVRSNCVTVIFVSIRGLFSRLFVIPTWRFVDDTCANDDDADDNDVEDDKEEEDKRRNFQT